MQQIKMFAVQTATDLKVDRIVKEPQMLKRINQNLADLNVSSHDVISITHMSCYLENEIQVWYWGKKDV